MKTTGMARRIDELGRIVLPVELRRSFGIRPGDELEITVDSGRIVLAKVEAGCTFCGSDAELRRFRDRDVCASCASELAPPDSES